MASRRTVDLILGEARFLFGVAEEEVELFAGFLFLTSQFSEGAAQVDLTIVDHVFDDGPRGVEGTGLLAGGGLGLFVVGCQEVLEDLSKFQGRGRSPRRWGCSPQQ